jgi:hypothetical protein
VTDFAEIWIVLTLLNPGEGSRVLEPELDASLRLRVGRACEKVKLEGATGAELVMGQETGARHLAMQNSATEGKQFYIAWLKDRYGYNIAKINEAYGLEMTSFSDLSESDFRQVDRKRKAVAEDDRLFLLDLESMLKQKVDEMFQACAAGFKTAWKRNRT